MQQQEKIHNSRTSLLSLNEDDEKLKLEKGAEEKKRVRV